MSQVKGPVTLANGAFSPNVGGEMESVVTIAVGGGFTGTVSFWGGLNGTDYALAATPLSGGSAVTTTTSAGIWRVDGTALDYVRVGATTISAGNPVVTLKTAKG